MNNWKKTALLAGAAISLAGCNDTKVYHVYIPHFLNISYDWSKGEAPDADGQVTLTITGQEDETTLMTPVEGTDVPLYMGDYTIVAANPPADVAYDNAYTVGVNVSGALAAEPSAAFGAGEGAVTVVKNVTPDDLVIEMTPQTRVLIVEIVFENAAGHLVDEAGRFRATMNNVTVSRDISQGFAPYGVARQTESPAYADFLLEFAQVENGETNDLLFRASHRLLGLGTERKDFVFEYYDGDVAASQLRFLTLEGVGGLADFHTRTPLDEPYVLRITLTAYNMNSTWAIIDWKTGTFSDLIAIEQ